MKRLNFKKAVVLFLAVSLSAKLTACAVGEAAVIGEETAVNAVTSCEVADSAKSTTAEMTEELFVEEVPIPKMAAESPAPYSVGELVRGTYAADDVSVKVNGRTMYKDGVRWLSYSYSSVEFRFTGTCADITIVSDSPEYRSSRKARIAFFVDGVMVQDVILNSYEQTFNVFKSDVSKDVVIKVVKLSEAQYAKAGVKYITVDSENKIAPTPKSERKIEFLGDSITCAYGIEGTKYSDFSTHTENAYNGYAAQTARNLGADCDIIAWSGIGVVSDCTRYGKKSSYLLMPELYKYTDYALEISKKDKTLWDFSRDPADVIVINLGTNDYTYTKNNQTLLDEFGIGYYNLVVQARNNNPNAVIVCTMGAMGCDPIMDKIEEKIAEFKEINGDKKLYTLRFDTQLHEDGYGADYHPSLSTHNKMTVKLTLFIREIMDW